MLRNDRGWVAIWSSLALLIPLTTLALCPYNFLYIPYLYTLSSLLYGSSTLYMSHFPSPISLFLLLLAILSGAFQVGRHIDFLSASFANKY